MPVSGGNVLCCGCGACADACPANCISMRENEEGFLYPDVDMEKCTHCGLCERVCVALTRLNDAPTPKAYGCFSLAEEVRRNSSSGGVFYELARTVLLRGGCVFGVSMDKNCLGAGFEKAETEEELQKLMRSKYVQAAPNHVYRAVKQELESGREVLFSGTPCQNNALRLYLGKDYERLCCVDLICHGTPSPKLWRWHVDYVQCARGGFMTEVNFRCKETGWRNFCIDYHAQSVDDTRKRFYFSQDVDPYFQMFLKNLSLRPSCYRCASKTARLSDITIGDFWGIESVLPEMDSEKGVSVVFVRTEKGREAFDAVCDRVTRMEVAYEVAARLNPTERGCSHLPKRREAFFRDMNSMPFAKLAKKYGKKPLYRYVGAKAKRIWKKLVTGGGGVDTLILRDNVRSVVQRQAA